MKKKRASRKTVQLGLPGLASVRGDPGPPLAKHAGIEFLCGVDEAGRGPLAGPIVAAAVLIHVDDVLPKCDDSKVLTALQRQGLLEPIRRKSRGHGVCAVAPGDIDRIGIVGANFLAMRTAVADAMKMAGVAECFIVVDGRDLIAGLPMRQYALVDGDARCRVVSAASILAKEHRDSLLCDLDLRVPQYGFARHKGYATPEHMEALIAHGPCDHHRRTFEPIKSFLMHGNWTARADMEALQPE